MESQNHGGMLSVIQSNRNSIIVAITIVIHKSRSLIDTLGSSESGHKQGQVFRSVYESLLTEAPNQVKQHRETMDYRYNSYAIDLPSFRFLPSHMLGQRMKYDFQTDRSKNLTKALN